MKVEIAEETAAEQRGKSPATGIGLRLGARCDRLPLLPSRVVAGQDIHPPILSSRRTPPLIFAPNVPPTPQLSLVPS